MSKDEKLAGPCGSPLTEGLGPLGEPLFLLHCGAVYDGERDDWGIEANSGRAVDLVADMHPGQTLGLYTEHAVRGLLAKGRERCAAFVQAQADACRPGSEEQMRLASAAACLRA